MTPRRPLLAVSATEADAERLRTAGPRRDFLELAAATGGELVCRPEAPRRGGLREKVLGPHVRQAWELARRASRGQRIFADGEHVGLPLLAFLGLRGRRSGHVVMLGHLVSRRWKLPLLWLATRAGPRGTLVLHSVEQQRIARPWLGRRWRTALVPYQADTSFWRPGLDGDRDPRLIVAVGAENRDYGTLFDAVRGLDVRLVVAAGSHWARSAPEAKHAPPNVEVIAEALPFRELLALYRRAAAVVVPLHDVPNQSGVTTVLEAMACGRTVIVTATRGQREVVRGPLVRALGEPDAEATSDRGPHLLLPHLEPAKLAQSGLYVLPGDARGLRRAIELVLSDPGLAARLGEAGRTTAVRAFTTERYVAALAGLVANVEPAAALAAVARLGP